MRQNFTEWMKAVDDAIARKADGLVSLDLPDCCYADWHEEGMTPAAAARLAIKNAKE